MVFAWATTTMERRLQAKLLGCLFDPADIAIRTSATNASADGFQFRFRLRHVDLFDPVGRLGQRPLGQ